MLDLNKIYNMDCLKGLRQCSDGSVDLLLTDSPYGLSFMGKDWDKAIPKVKIWKECCRVLKPGSFAFIMCIPRQDCLSRMIVNLGDAGFRTDFTSIFWTYSSGFPKAQNIGLTIDKQECRKQLIKKLGRKPTKEEFDDAWKAFRKVIGKEMVDIGMQSGTMHAGRPVNVVERDKTIATSDQAKALDGSYTGAQFKPAVEVIICVQKPMAEKTYVNQALLWYEERQKILTELESELKKKYKLDNIEWEDE